MASDSLEQLYHQHPESFERLAHAVDNPFTEKMKAVVEQEQNETKPERQRVPADD